MTRQPTWSFRPSGLDEAVRLVEPYPGQYPVEQWQAHYWHVTAQGALLERHVALSLPTGYARALPVIEVGQAGCVSQMRSWGFACSPDLLNSCDFDVAPLLTHDATRFPDGEDQEWMHVYLAVTRFELPGYFIIADQDYAFLLFDPQGDLKGSWVRGPTYLAALTWLVTQGKVSADFSHLQFKDRDLYARAVAEMLAALE